MAVRHLVDRSGRRKRRCRQKESPSSRQHRDRRQAAPTPAPAPAATQRRAGASTRAGDADAARRSRQSPLIYIIGGDRRRRSSPSAGPARAQEVRSRYGRARPHARLYRPTPAADHPDPVRHHGAELRDHPVRARRPGRADDRRRSRAPASRRPNRLSAAAVEICRQRQPDRTQTASSAYRGASGLDPEHHQGDRDACTASTSRATSASG